MYGKITKRYKINEACVAKVTSVVSIATEVAKAVRNKNTYKEESEEGEKH